VKLKRFLEMVSFLSAAGLTIERVTVSEDWSGKLEFEFDIAKKVGP